MAEHSALTLPWLPPAPLDFVERCKALSKQDTDLGPHLSALSGFALNSSQSSRLGKVLARALEHKRDLSPLSKFRLGVLASGTVDLLLDCLPAAAMRHGIALELIRTPFDQVMQQALDSNSIVNAAKPDAVLFAIEHRWLNIESVSGPEDARARVHDAVGRVAAAVEALKKNSGCPAILPTVPAPSEALFGSFDRRHPGAVRAMICRFNDELVALAEQTGSYLLDVEDLANRIGHDVWFDPLQWASYKLPFSNRCDLAYADLLGRLLGAIRGKARKCLVLDLDNTIWGGAVGDDGVAGILIGQGSPEGEAFASVQQFALDLRRRGILLAVCSKNDEAVARLPFREHSGMLLRETDIAVFQANWTSKAGNLETIARTLNIGIDALVFLDDNPSERAQVRAALPMVGVPELPNDPALYPRYLSSAGYFEAVSFSAEDSLRAESYVATAKRAEVQSVAHNLEDYLSQLEMRIAFSSFDRNGRQRIAQLINKTNQFNLTTRRYTETDVANMETDPLVTSLQVRLSDKFGDFGMIGVIICRSRAGQSDVWDIDTWLMSCRVLGRRVEEAMLAQLVTRARSAGVRKLVGTYLPTAKNAMVADHYSKLGFQRIANDGDPATFELDVGQYAEPSTLFSILVS